MFGKKKTLIVERYKSDKEMQKGLNKMAKKGYVVSERTTEKPQTSFGRLFLRGLTFGVAGRKSSEHVVTYSLLPQPEPEKVS